MESKYALLRDYLLASSKDRVKLSFDEIEEIIGASLPNSARMYRSWWANDEHHTQARNGWMAAGYLVSDVDLERETVLFVRREQVTRRSPDNDKSRSLKGPIEFENFARRVMSNFFGVPLYKRRKECWPKEFDMVSPDYKIVGDAKYYSMVRGEKIPPAKFSAIAEHVWMLEKIDADIKFLVFGNDKRVPVEWLKRYGHLVKGVVFYFIHEDGTVEELSKRKKLC